MAELILPSGHVAKVDAEDLAVVQAAGPWRFHANNHVIYVRRSLDSTREQYLHAFLTGYPMTDHRNGDGLDNRRANLRPANPSLNAANRIRLRGTSGYRGITRHGCGRWQAAICVRGERRYLGLHSSPEEAARAYDLAAIAAFGEYARPNFPVAVVS